MALFEIMTIDDEPARAGHEAGVSTNVLRARPASAACARCARAGLLAIYEGQTTIDEVVARRS
jgi:hypothetical protein